MPKFLTDEWVAQARAIEAEFKGKAPAPAAAAKINLTITEVPAEISEGDIAASLDTTSGALELDLGNFPDADAGMTLGYDTARSFLVDGNQQAVMQAFMGGKVRITGDMTKVLALASNPGDEAVAKEFQQRLLAITE